jgi:hypothetical protein
VDPQPPGIYARHYRRGCEIWGSGARTRGWRPEVPGRGHSGSEDGGGAGRAVGRMAGARAGGSEDAGGAWAGGGEDGGGRGR